MGPAWQQTAYWTHEATARKASVYSFMARARDRAGDATESCNTRLLLEFASFLLSTGYRKGDFPTVDVHHEVKAHIEHGVDIATAVRVVLKNHKEEWYDGYSNSDKGEGEGPKAQDQSGGTPSEPTGGSSSGWDAGPRSAPECSDGDEL